MKKHDGISVRKMVGSRDFKPRRRAAIFCPSSAAGELRTASEPRQSRPVSVCTRRIRGNKNPWHRSGYGTTAPGFQGEDPLDGTCQPTTHRPSIRVPLVWTIAGLK